MSILPMPRVDNGYPTSDGRPMAETDIHRDLMIDLIATLRAYYAREENVYVSGNLLICYDRANGRRHVSPDVFVVEGVEKHTRDNFLVWEEGRAPCFVIELTSASTRDEDLTTKMALYRDVLKVKEYYLFDPNGEYLTPSMRGLRLRGGVYRQIRPVAGRLPSQTTGLHLERDGTALRFWNPVTEERLPLPIEDAEQRVAEEALARRSAERRAAAETRTREAAEQRATGEALARREAEGRAAASAVENTRLRRELAILRGEAPPAD